MHVKILQPTERELIESIDYYNAECPGLGIMFAHEIRLCINRIKAHPYAWTRIDASFRCCPTNRFPFSTVFQIMHDAIMIVAFMHHKRYPEYWRSRIAR